MTGSIAVTRRQQREMAKVETERTSERWQEPREQRENRRDTKYHLFIPKASRENSTYIFDNFYIEADLGSTCKIDDPTSSRCGTKKPVEGL
jgi:hypothetical protein